MIKTISLLHARSGLPQQEFRERYERVHAPLVTQLLGPFAGYRRDYVGPESRLLPSATYRRPDFDALTSIWFEDAASLEALGERLAIGDAGVRITADEEQMFERTRMAMTLVDERTSLPGAAPAAAEARRKLTLLAARRRNLTHEEFVEVCEHDAARVTAERETSGLVALVRNYVVPGGAFDLRHIEGNTGVVGFDVQLELHFADIQRLVSFATSEDGIGSFSGIVPVPRTGRFEAFVAIADTSLR